MRLVAAAVVTWILVLSGNAHAGGSVDWSSYIDKNGSSKLPQQKSSPVADAPPPTPMRGARASKAKTSKSKAHAKTHLKAKAKPKAAPKATNKSRR